MRESARNSTAHSQAGADLAERLSATDFKTASSALRAELRSADASGAELAFHYLGPTAKDEPWASGEIRRQIGLKLRAQDTCNVIYAMWHIAPRAGLEVSVKSNPGQHEHAQCSDHGYTFLQPSFLSEPARVEVGSSHRLRAQLSGSRVLVYVDDVLSWAGELPEQALALHGPAGVRSDNGMFTVQLRAAGESL